MEWNSEVEHFFLNSWNMFILATIKDVIRIEPHKFAEEHVAVRD